MMTFMQPLVSIVIATYNSEKTVARTLESIAGQDFRSFEVVVVDGLSRDRTGEIVNGFKSKLPQLSFISERDSGIYDALNKGIKAANGTWVYFLGSDDSLYAPTTLSSIFSHNLDGYDVVYGSVFNHHLNRVYDGEFNNEKMVMDGICHQSIFYRRELFNRFGMYDVEMKVYAHIYLDKILFTDPSVKWKYLDVIVANYSGDGMSRYTLDLKYWRHAEELLNKCFKGKLPAKKIYSALIPYVQWHFSADTFFKAMKISVKTNEFRPMLLWFNHPYQIMRLTLKKVFKN